MRLGDAGWMAEVSHLASPNCDERDEGAAVSLLVVHSISLPPGCYGGDAIERLFTNRLEPRDHPYYEVIAELRVSAHFLVRREGAITQFVPVQQRAWHAGLSAWRGRPRCNDFSLGIELEGADGDAFTDAQYASLASLVRALRAALPLRQVAAHSDVAPERKTDPGARFEWMRFLRAVATRS